MRNKVKIHFCFFLIMMSYSCSQTKIVDVVHVTPGEKDGASSQITEQLKMPGIIAGSAKIPGVSKQTKKTYFLYGAEHLKLDNYYFDIPVVYNAAVKKWLDYFLNKGRNYFKRYSIRAGRYAPLLGNILEDHGLPRDLIFLAMAESGFRNTAKSWAKAVGPWQFMPYTGKKFGLNVSWYIDERRDPIKATIAACKYLSALYKRFGSWELATAAYNAGEGKISRAIRRYKTESFWELRKGRYLKSETKNYVPKIMALAIIGKNLKSFGLERIDFHMPLDFAEIDVEPFTDLILLAEALRIDFSELQRLNPELLRWYTPPNGEQYKLRVPTHVMLDLEEMDMENNFKAVAFQIYSLKGTRGTLKDVAKKFKVKPYVLEDINNVSSTKVLKKGTKLYLPFRVDQSRRAAMYQDLYERPRKSVLRRRNYRRILRMAKKRGKKLVGPPSKFYTVKKGDSLWSVSRHTGVPLNNLIVSNLALLQKRMIRKGDKLIVK